MQHINIPIERGSLKRASRPQSMSKNKSKPTTLQMSSSSPPHSLQLSASTTHTCEDIDIGIDASDVESSQICSKTTPSSISSTDKVKYEKKKMKYIDYKNTKFYSLKNLSTYRKKYKSIHSTQDNANTIDYEYKMYLHKLLKSQQMDFHKLVILDWDDTLFPTSAVSRSKLRSFEGNPLFHGETKQLYYALRDIIDRIISLFDTIIAQNGKIVIVTNAAYGWINGIFNGYYSGVVGRLFDKLAMNMKQNKVEIISARDDYLSQHPHSNRFIFDGQIAKTEAMRHIFKKLTDDKEVMTRIPIIYCIGDGMDEFNASRIAWNDVIGSRFISVLQRVKFLEKPNIDILMQEIQTQIN